MRRTTLLTSGAVAVLILGCGAEPAAPGAQPTPQVVYVTPAPSGAGSMDQASINPSAIAEPSPSAIAELSPAAPPTQDELRATSGKAYLAAVKPYNKELDRLWKKYKNKTSLKASKAYCAKLDVTLRKWIVALQGITFPDDTKADAKQLIRWNAAKDAHMRTCAKARNFRVLNAAWAAWDTAADRAVEYANLVRLDLDLPPVPG